MIQPGSARDDAWRGAELPPMPSWDGDARGPSAPHMAPEQIPRAVWRWKRRMLLWGAVLTLAAGFLFLYAVYVIREQPMLGYVAGAASVLAVSFGVLFVKFSLWGPFPDRLLGGAR